MVDRSVDDLLREEKGAGAGGEQYFRSFGERVHKLRTDLLQELDHLRDAGSKIAAYGASAKGSTLLNFCGLGPGDIDFVVDRSPHKQGKLTPGTHLLIMHPHALLERRPEVTLLLTWNFAEEIAAQQRDYLTSGGRFLVPVPQPHYQS